MGSMDRFIMDPPMSLLYVASKAIQENMSVKIIDQRICYKEWKEAVHEELRERPLLVGISTMTGRPLHYALEISKFIKEHSDVPIVWGGHHPTILPENTLKNSKKEPVGIEYEEVFSVNIYQT